MDRTYGTGGRRVKGISRSGGGEGGRPISPSDVVLTVNAGSSSLRLAAYSYTPEGLRQDAAQRVDGSGRAEGPVREFVDRYRIARVLAVAHRVVHGGSALVAPCVIDDRVEAEIGRMAALAPLHNPPALAAIHACRALFGMGVPQVAVIDTGFYAHLPEVARSYALPRRLGLRRYGFHGIAHQAMWRRWHNLRPEIANGGRVISLQLGAGCSITAVADGVPQDTSMGFTPLEGLVMATRGGDLDPGALLYLLREAGLTVTDLDTLLNKESGLRGLAGDGDMRALLTNPEPEARHAIDLYCYRARKYVGAYLAVLGGADAILFGGGVGEHAASVRGQILAGLEWAGIHLDAAANTATKSGERRISAPDSRVDIWIIPVDESAILAEEAFQLLVRAVAPESERRTT